MGEFRKGGPVLAAGMIGVACGASPIPFNVLPAVIGPVHAELGWSFLEINLGITTFGVIASLLSPVYGGAADRWGVRPVAIASLVAFGLAFALFAVMPPTKLAWFGMWALVGLVGIGSTPVTWSRAVNMWFVQNRGLALGILLLGTSLAGIVVPQLARAAIDGAFFGSGWRAAFPTLALLPLLVALPLTLWLFREPRPEERPAGLSGADGKLLGLSLGTAVRGYRFWVIWVSIACVALAFGGAFINMVEITRLHGFTAAQGATVMSVLALGILVGRLVTGLLFDRFWAPAVLVPILAAPALSCVLLMGSGAPLGTLMAAAVLLGFAAGAESDLIAYLAGRYFGMAHYGKIYGMLYMPFGIGSAISPAIYGAVRDATGNYDAMLSVAVGLFLVGALLPLLLGRYPEAPALAPPALPPTVPA
ncbi:MFS family permease [Polymorphobacter multimanifer]|uniref:MFS family permease n=1 Tax=Polymorphobacter multimanifer TaxID=1070431 RepID=A0A841LHS6_9SPHN|nr:MFS transporter [Polymorphobacter multimanifer]MBB6228518.1 MFS family permease [Polymorphobacter multimanifer]